MVILSAVFLNASIFLVSELWLLFLVVTIRVVSPSGSLRVLLVVLIAVNEPCIGFQIKIKRRIDIDIMK
jgi:hypothetical protein